MITNQEITRKSLELYFGYAYIRPEWFIDFKETKEIKKPSKLFHLFRLLVGEAAIAGYKSTFKFNYR